MFWSWHSETNMVSRLILLLKESMRGKSDKYARLSDRIIKAKQEKIKEVQDQWKSQFFDGDSKVTGLLKEQGMNDGEKVDEANEQLQKEYEQQARIQKYTEYDGQKVYMAGLDISLLKQQKQTLKEPTNTQQLLQRVAMKVKVAEKVNKVSGNKLYRMMLANMFQDPPETKNPIDLNSYYVFDIDEFGQAAPRKLIKRPGKFHKNPVFPAISEDKLNQIEEMVERNQKRRELMAVFATRQEPQIDVQEEDSDDIFATDQRAEIEIGKKLDFGIQEEEEQPIQLPEMPGMTEPQTIQDFQNEQEQLLKLDKVKKKRKLMQQQINKPSYMQPSDPYSECFWNTGPTLEETTELKKQGVVIDYQDEKDFKRKERKINYNKEFEKIQRIIAEKQNKPK